MANRVLKKGFKLAFVNARSMMYKMIDIKECLKDYDVVGINETWLKETSDEGLIYWEGRVMYRNDREGKKAGGVLLYVKNELSNYVDVIDNGVLTSDNLEMVSICLSRPHVKKCVISSLYRPPSGKADKFVEELEEFVVGLDNINNELWLGGDYNIDVSDLLENKTQMLKSFADVNGLDIKIDKITRPKDNAGTVIDNILTNAKNVVQSMVLPSLISDHRPVMCIQKKPRENVVVHEFMGRSYRKYDRQDIEEHLIYHCWKSFYKEKDPNLQWDMLVVKVIEYLDRVCPMKRIVAKGNNSAWLTQDLREAIADRDRYMIEYDKYNDSLDLQRAKETRVLINRMSEDAKRGQINEAYEDNVDGYRQFWKKIAELVKPRPSETRADFVHHETNERVPSEEAADYFNEFFATVGDKMCEKLKFDISNTPDVAYNVVQPDSPVLITLDMTQKLIDKIDIHKSSGIDGINARILKDVLNILAPQLENIFGKSLEFGIFPDKWATSMVVPIPKAGQLSNISNWRPINLLPTPGRLLEKIVHAHILGHLQRNELLTKAQFGFRPGLGTTDAIFDFVNFIYDKLDRGQQVAVCYIDGSKAFDSVNHSLLLRKCKALQIHPQVCKWLESYLHNRRQSTALNGVKSKEHRVGFGVPQGSSLGPLLFLLFINDFPDCIVDCKLFMYADDIVLVANGDSHIDAGTKLGTDVANAKKWCDLNCITINKKKNKVMRINRPGCRGAAPPPLEIFVDEVLLEDVDEYKYLGVSIDSQLSFKPHVNSSIKVINHKLYLLGHIRRYMSEQQSLLIYKQMVIPYTEYASFILDCSTQELAAKIQKLQSRALRICRFNNRYERTSVTALHEYFKIDYVAHRRHVQLLMMMYKKSKTLGQLVQPELRRTRGDSKVKFDGAINRYRSTDKSPWTRGVVLWDKLKAEVQTLPKSTAYKNKINALDLIKLNKDP